MATEELEIIVTRLRPGTLIVAVLLSRLGVILGLLVAAPLVGLPAVNVPDFFGSAFAPTATARFLGWVVFVAIGAIAVWLFRALAGPLHWGVALALTVAFNWVVCGALVLPSAVFWGPRVGAGVVPAPGFFGLGWYAAAPWTLLLAFALSAPGLLLASG